MTGKFLFAKLDAIMALNEQCVFSQENGYTELYSEQRMSLISKYAMLIVQGEEA